MVGAGRLGGASTGSSTPASREFVRACVRASVILRHVDLDNMDFQSAMETFAEAWAAANANANAVKSEMPSDLSQVSESCLFHF